jgi:hypothetical protein
MRTVDEVLARIEEIENTLVGSMTVDDLYEVLTYEEAKSKLRPEVTVKDWGEGQSRSHESARNKLVSYLPFAIEKALGHRGISASRSVSHFKNWIFLMEDLEAQEFIADEGNYAMYGVPIIKYLLNRYNVEYEFSSPEELKRFECMAKGECCGSGMCE